MVKYHIANVEMWVRVPPWLDYLYLVSLIGKVYIFDMFDIGSTPIPGKNDCLF